MTNHPNQDRTTMSTIRFIHAADLHLDSPFRGIRSEAPNHVAQALSSATFDAYRNITDLCIQQEVHALLVAGDIYDGADRSLRAQLRFVDGLARLDRAGIRSFICHGNHDPLDGWEARLDLPEGCVRFGSEVEGFPLYPDEPGRGTVYGISYPTKEVRDNLAPRFAAAVSYQGYRIGLLHANVGGNQDHDSYAPCSPADLADAGFDYWALGHVHTRQVLRTGDPAIVYPGNPQGRHPNEPGARGVYLVEVDDHGGVHLNFQAVDVVRWETLTLDIGPLETEQALLDKMDELASAALDSAEGRSVVARLELTGRGPLHRWLSGPGTAEEMRERLNERHANQDTWLWCEGLRLATASPVDREASLGREDFVGDLLRLSSELRTGEGTPAELRELLQPLYDRRDVRDLLRDHAPTDEDLQDLLALAEEECLAALAEEDETP